MVDATLGFSGADVKALCTEAAMGPIRDVTTGALDINALAVADVPPIQYRHFREALASVRPSVSEKDLGTLLDWNDLFGSFPRDLVNVKVTEEDGGGGGGRGGGGGMGKAEE